MIAEMAIGLGYFNLQATDVDGGYFGDLEIAEFASVVSSSVALSSSKLLELHSFQSSRSGALFNWGARGSYSRIRALELER